VVSLRQLTQQHLRRCSARLWSVSHRHFPFKTALKRCRGPGPKDSLRSLLRSDLASPISRGRLKLCTPTRWHQHFARSREKIHRSRLRLESGFENYVETPGVFRTRCATPGNKLEPLGSPCGYRFPNWLPGPHRNLQKPVELRGLEPLTPCMPCKCSAN
jgi:hypothetical protein